MSSSPAVSLKGVGKYYEIYQKPRQRLWQILWRGRKQFYQEYWACADINLEVGKGECLGIIGRNGAGKSTLLQLMAGTLSPSIGKIAISGRVAALLELGSGFNPEFSGRENVYLNAAILGLSQREITARYPKIVEFADIGDFIDRPVKTYSSGMALRLAFAVMANVDADILIIDEALAVGDAFFTQKCMRFLRQFIASHTVILVSHDINAICSLCSRAILLETGRIKLAGSARAVSQKYLEDQYEERQGQEQMHLAARSSDNRTPIGPLRDMRQDLFNNSHLRNDIELFQFSKEEIGFGAGNGEITDVYLANAAGEKYNWIVGSEIVFLHIVCSIHKPMRSPIIGFLVINSFGQQLFSDNTWLAYREENINLDAGATLEAVFQFQMPILAPGEYYITAALAEGTPENHIQHHWRHEALVFSSHTSSVATGLMGVPMLTIELREK